jgi:hypothetical protein
VFVLDTIASNRLYFFNQLAQEDILAVMNSLRRMITETMMDTRTTMATLKRTPMGVIRRRFMT